jgi:protein-L-isoaspartate(D-aspartate) O-methyltransferase
MRGSSSFIFWSLLQLALLVAGASNSSAQDDRNVARRNALVRKHIVANGVENPSVIDSLLQTPRHQFVPEVVRRAAYQDTALPIGYGQTISSPYIVARMTEQLDPQPTDRVLEVGTGSGYQAAVLSPIVDEVFSIEIVPELGQRAATTLSRLGYENVHVRVGDGYQGWPENAPFDKIIVTCSPENIPAALAEQLKEGGHLVIPVGERYQQVLYRFTKVDGKLKKQRIESTFFVPMTGVAESKRQKKADDAKPEIVNGSFELKTAEGEPHGWYYLRGSKVEDAVESPDGVRCLAVEKLGAERAIAIQPVGIDGEKLSSLQVSFASRGERIHKGLFALQCSQLVVEFYDEDRNLCGDAAAELPAGSFDWQPVTLNVDVPPQAKLAMFEFGLFGATGKILFDDVRISAKSRIPAATTQTAK